MAPCVSRATARVLTSEDRNGRKLTVLKQNRPQLALLGDTSPDVYGMKHTLWMCKMCTQKVSQLVVEVHIEFETHNITK